MVVELPSFATVVVVCGFMATVVIPLVRAVLKARDENAELKRRVKIMWGAQVNRGRVEAESSGALIATPSWLPDMLDGRVREHFAKMRDDLRAFYRSTNHKLSFDDLLLEIEGKFGQRIVDDICRPLGLTQVACLHAAAIVARETDTVHVTHGDQA